MHFQSLTLKFYDLFKFEFSLIVNHYDLFKLIKCYQILNFNINQIKCKSLNLVLLEKDREVSGR